MNILVADDEQDIRILIKTALEKKGYQVYEAADGMEAFERIMKDPIDMAILDVLMPEMDGFHLLRQIRKRSNLPVMFLTAKTEEKDKVFGLQLGADDYLEKPFGIPELIARVDAALRRTNTYDAAGRTQDVICYERFQLDVNACVLYKDGAAVSLTAKEYGMMKYFMQNIGKVFTKKSIYETVWEDEYCYDDNTIMVTISRLRNKIEEEPQNPQYLHTVKGLGYQFRKVCQE